MTRFGDYRDYIRPPAKPPEGRKWPIVTTKKKAGDQVLTSTGWKTAKQEEDK